MCNCTHGLTEGPLPGDVEFCVECVEGCDLELLRLVRSINGFHDQIRTYQVKARNGGLAKWEAVELRGLTHSHAFLVEVHDRIEARRLTLIGSVAL